MANTKRKQPVPRTSQPAPKKPIGKWLIYTIVGAGVVGLVALMVNTPEEIPGGIPDGAQAVVIGEPDHIEGPIDYGVAVPAGGPMSATPLVCGIYDQPVPVENTMHSLEHGAVWVTYRPDLDDSVIGDLESAAGIRSKVILSPVPNQTSPIMATAWGWQLELDDPTDIRLRQFIQGFEGGSTSPEPGAGCTSGVGLPVG